MIAVIWPRIAFAMAWYDKEKKYISIACESDMEWRSFDAVVLNYWHLVKKSEDEIYKYYKSIYKKIMCRIKD